MCHTFSVSSFSGKVRNIGIPLVKKTQFLSLLPVSSRFTHYQSWLYHLVAYLVGYVSDNFGFRFNWGLGSVVALAADEALNGGLLEPSLENWPLLGLPWIVLWLKELIIWGTLEPVAAYLLSKSLEVTRASAEKEAQAYYEEKSQEQDVNELLNAATIRDWATNHYSREKNLPLLRPPDRMQVELHQDFSKVETRQWKVIPVEVEKILHWFDPAGILLATCGRPTIWHDSFLNNYDFMLDVNEKMVSSEGYISFR